MPTTAWLPYQHPCNATVPPLLTIAVASSALFDLSAGDAVFQRDGREAYRAYQRHHEHEAPPAGVAMPFIRRLLAAGGPLVEVILLSKNDPDTGLRVRNAITHHALPIRHSAFTGGASPWPYLEAFDAALFLSANRDDVVEAIRAGHAAGVVTANPLDADTGDAAELRIAFDFDGVLADDEAERRYRQEGLSAYHAVEDQQRDQALTPGPLHRFLERLGKVQAELGDQSRIRTAIITARSAPADRRVVASLRAWGVRVDEAFFVGDRPKDRILRHWRPHLFFDDKRANADLGATVAPSVHVPFGVLNERG